MILTKGARLTHVEKGRDVSHYIRYTILINEEYLVFRDIYSSNMDSLTTNS